MNEEKLRKYFNENTIQIGEDVKINPPLYYISLRDAYEHYFLTFRDVKDTIWHQMQTDLLEKKNFMFQFKGKTENVVFTILSFHRFFELLLKDILEKLDPYLKVKFPQNERDVIAYIDRQLDPKEIQTLEANETKKRINAAFDYYRHSPKYIAVEQYEFVREAFFMNTFTILTEWRNRILHNGNKTINILALDYLVSQRIIPLSKKIIEIQGTELAFEAPYFFKTKTGIEVINEILKIKFEFGDFNNSLKYSQLRDVIMKLGHLKEIGRASMNNDFFKRQNISYYDKCEDPINRSERFAESEKDAKYFSRINNCICCGANALVIYKSVYNDTIILKKQIVSHWSKCYNCDYSIGSEVGDPYMYGICKEPLFT